MNNYNLDDEKQSYPYEYYGRVIEEEHGEGIFLMRSALSYVVDDYDEYLGSVEQSHYEDLGYYEVVNFNLPDTIDTLDLTWMKKDDIFFLEANNQFQFIREIRVNIDNLGYSHIPVKSISNNGLFLTVNGAKSKSSIIQQIKGFKSFVMGHGICLSGIKLEGFLPVVEKLLTLYAKKCGVAVDEQFYESRRYK